MGCGGDTIKWFADPLGSTADALGLPVDATRVGWAPWEIGKLGTYIQNDWRKIKHWLVPDMRRDRETMVNSSMTPRRRIYGRVRVSGQLAYVESAGDQNQFLHLVIILAGHRVSGFGAVALDDKPISEYGDKAYHELFDGSQTTACATLVAASAGLWTNDHKLLGCAYIYLRLTYSEDSFPTIPKVTVVTDGALVYDPRTGLTAWSDNAALCCYDYMRLSEIDGGMDCDDDEIDVASVIAAANICDQMVVKNQGGTEYEKRYTCNGTIDLNGTPKQLLSALLQSMGGTPIFTEGVWKIYAAAYQTPLETTLDETWLNGGISFSVGPNKNDRINTMTGTYVDPDDHWAVKGFPAVTSATYIADDDGEELTQDLPLNFTTSPTMAQRLAKIIMERSRSGMQANVPCNFKAFRLSPYDVLPVNIAVLGWEGLICRLADWQFSGTSGVQLSLEREDASFYSWVPGDVIEVTTPPLTNLPDPRVVFPPGSLSLAPRTYTYNSGSSTRMDLVVSWTPGSPGRINYQVQYRLVGAAAWSENRETFDTELVIEALAAGDYEVQVRGVNSLGAESVWVSASTYVPNPDETVPNITGLELWGQGNNQQFTGREVVLRWNKPTPRLLGAATGPASPNQPDAWFRYYKVEVYDGNDVLRRPAEYRVTEKYVYTFEMNHQDGGGTPTRNLRFRVTAVAGWGKESAVPAYLEVSNPSAAKIPSMQVVAMLESAGISWEPSTEPDVTVGGHYVLHASQTPGFTPTESTRANRGPEASFTFSRAPGSEVDGVGGPWYFRVAAVDSFGEYQLNWSDEYSADISTLSALDTVPPDVPTALSAATGIEQVAQAQTAYVNLSWSAPTAADLAAGDFNPANGKGGYIVRYKQATDTFWTEQPAHTANSAKVTGLVPNTSYQFQVRAFDEHVNATVWSSVLTTTTAKKTAAPSAISDASLKVYGGLKSIWVEWTPVTDRDVAYYEIWVGENGAPEIYRAYFENQAGYGDTDPTVSLYYPLSAWAAGPTFAKDPIQQPSLWGVYKTFASITDPEYLGYPVYAMNTSYVNTRPFRTLSNKFVFDILGTTYVTHHVKVRVVDTSGNASAWSSVKTSDPSKVVYSDIYVANLAAINADLGEVTAGTVKATVSVETGALISGTVRATTAILVGSTTNGIEIHGGNKTIKIFDNNLETVRLGQQVSGYHGLTITNPSGQDVLKFVRDAAGTYRAVIQNLTGGDIDANVVTLRNLVVGGNVTMGPSATIAWSQVNGTGKPADSATVGATWGVDLGSIPARFGAAPSGDGLFITASYLGYHAGGTWKTYMDNAGNLICGNPGGGQHGIAWNQTAGTMTIRGSLTADDIQSGGAITGNTLQTTAAGNAQRVVIDRASNDIKFYGNTGSTYNIDEYLLAKMGMASGSDGGYAVLGIGSVYTDHQAINCNSRNAWSTVRISNQASYVDETSPAASLDVGGPSGYSLVLRGGGFIGMAWSDAKGHLKMRPGAYSGAPSWTPGSNGVFSVNNAGNLYYYKNGWIQIA